MRFADTVETTVLPNGLTVITDYYPRAEHDPYRGVLAAALVSRLGSNDDPVDLNGRAHFAEHMIAHASGQFATPKDFKRFCESLCLQESNLGTNTEFTRYSAFGKDDRVQKYLDLIASGINGLHHKPDFLEWERGRIVNEMEDYLTEFNQVYRHTLLSAVFVQQSAGKWDGGYPRHLERMTLDDITAHHRSIHTAENMILMTSGAWTHEQACTWATEHLGALPTGQKYNRSPKIFVAGQPFLPQPYMYHAEAGHMVDYTIIYDAGFLNARQREALQLGCDILSKKIGESDLFYGMVIRSTDLNNHPVVKIFGSKLREERVRGTLSTVISGARNILENLTTSEFEAQKRQYVTVSDERWAQREHNPDNRISQIFYGYMFEGNPLHLDFKRETTPALEWDEVQDALRSVFRRVPVTIYTAARDGDFPRGQDLQKVWFGVETCPSPAAGTPAPS